MTAASRLTLPAAVRQGLLAGRRSSALRRVLAGNVAARLAALAALAAATVLVARVGGPDLVGGFTLLRVLPGLAGVLAAAGLPGAAPYFLSAPDASPAVRPTLAALTVLGAVAGALAWLALSPVLHPVFFPHWALPVTVACAAAVFSQLFVAVGKAALQGTGDFRGANAAIVAEEASYLPVYLAAIPFGRGMGGVLVALVVADLLVSLAIADRLRRRGFFGGWGRPDARLARAVYGYGTRGQLGGVMSLINLRLDVAILGAIAGPGVLGVYAIASKYAELLRLPGLAVTYVLYPVFSRRSPVAATERTRALLRPAFGLTVAAAIPLAAAAGLVLPALYGRSFHGAVVPTWILLAGLVGEGVTGLVTAYLYGIGRPGLNSAAIAVAMAVTVAGDLALIRPFGVTGAAVASAVAYLVTTVTVLVFFRGQARAVQAGPVPDPGTRPR
ncbi:MAG TPA: polysaccharide biosynthesis C-terminal domain-containing protein [Jatrophihabitans sp.]|nr:polysaccharide biosynthesis C-terminal domain-containing protein [Jatrophihabitans sp.]